VDDDDKSDVDDEEMEAVNAELAGQDAARQAATADQEKEKGPTVKKGVRIQGSTGVWLPAARMRAKLAK
jgi:hypothetical protein